MKSKQIDIKTWNRKQQFEFFDTFKDPFFSVCFNVDVTKAYLRSKKESVSFFVTYLHACAKAVNAVENLKYRIDENNNVVIYNVIHASATVMRPNETFGFSFIDFNEDFSQFNYNFNEEKQRIINSNELFPPKNGLDCFHCSALPWVNFTGHKEPFHGAKSSVPKIAFSKVVLDNEVYVMNIAISVNHALVDGYHVGLFSEKFQYYLNQ